MTNRHKTAYYFDGYFKVEYCQICSAEDLELQMPCCGGIAPRKKSASEIQREIDDQMDLVVDNYLDRP